MFNSLSGTITGKNDWSIMLENNGVEWEIFSSSKSISSFSSPGKTIRVLTYLHHKEDVLTLYGFYEEIERSVFLELIKISGIGPRQAIKILSSISAEDFIKALDREDVSILYNLPGIGKKTAQKIILSLRGRLLKDEGLPDKLTGEIIKALADMGFDYKKAAKAVSQILEINDFGNMQESDKEKEILKQAIVLLSG